MAQNNKILISNVINCDDNDTNSENGLANLSSVVHTNKILNSNTNTVTMNTEDSYISCNDNFTSNVHLNSGAVSQVHSNISPAHTGPINATRNISHATEVTAISNLPSIQNLEDIMDFDLPISNRYSELQNVVDEGNSLSQPLKKHCSSSSIDDDSRYEELNSLKFQMAKLQKDFSASHQKFNSNVEALQRRINAINSSIFSDDNSEFTVVKDKTNKRKLTRNRNEPVSNTISIPQTVQPSKPVHTISRPKPRAVSQPVSSVPVQSSAHAQSSNSEVQPAPPVINGSSNKLPPFFIYSFSHRNFKENFPNINFKMQAINANLKKFFVNNLADYLSVREKLEASESINFFTYTPKDIKPISYIIRGLDFSFSAEEIDSAIKAQFPGLTITKIDTFSTAFSRKSGKNTNLWLIQIASGSNVSEFRKLRLLLNSVVSIEPIKSGGVVQCRNCQRFDHIAINCGMPFRCVRCDKSHSPGGCLASEPASLTCVNCGGNHTANYGGCPKRAARIGLAGSARRSLPVRPANSHNINFPALPTRRTSNVLMPVSSNLSYANAVASANSTANNISSPFSLLQAEINSLFGCSLSAIINKFQAFIPTYSRTQDSSEKKMLLLGFLFEIVSNGA